MLSLWFLIYGGFVLRSGADRFIVTIYPSSGPAAFSVTMGLIALAAVLKKPRTMVRFARIVKPVLMGVLFLVAFFSLFSLDFSNLLPVTVHDVMPVMRGSVIAAAVLTVLPELLRSMNDYRMLIYAIVLIVVMIFNQSPEMIALRKRLTARFRKEDAEGKGAKDKKGVA